MSPTSLTIPDLPDISVPKGPETVFVVDDEPDMARGMQTLLERAGYEAHRFTEPEAALGAVTETMPKVLVTDYFMPSMNGLELAERVLEENPVVKVVLVTGAGNESVAQSALRAGVTNYVTKPFQADNFVQIVLEAFMAHAREEYAHASEAWLRDEIVRQTGLIRTMTVGTLKALLNAQEARTPHFRGHSQAVARASARIAHTLGLPKEEVSSIQTAGLLHDLGMIAVPDAVVNKPGKLTREEFDAVKTHPRQAAEILAPMKHLGPVVRYIVEHHERLDGSGYPDGKSGDEISMGGQIVGLAEVWTALTEDRSFRSGKSRAEAVETLSGTEGSWFSSDVLRALRMSEIGSG
ncbi:MAG TPA: HD domain-containing phosphohydrolase [Longimicrobiales bacterium]|nr:HD domain-containing phosphohydrolase [Longimicrobiales bacterium]